MLNFACMVFIIFVKCKNIPHPFSFCQRNGIFEGPTRTFLKFNFLKVLFFYILFVLTLNISWKENKWMNVRQLLPFKMLLSPTALLRTEANIFQNIGCPLGTFVVYIFIYFFIFIILFIILSFLTSTEILGHCLRRNKITLAISFNFKSH